MTEQELLSVLDMSKNVQLVFLKELLPKETW
ncbi:unnamed protein product, partial [marine sediment metagenome]